MPLPSSLSATLARRGGLARSAAVAFGIALLFALALTVGLGARRAATTDGAPASVRT